MSPETLLPPAPATDPRRRRHRPATVEFARRLYAGGDAWTPTQIQRLLAQRGVQVSVGTIRGWVVPGEAGRQRARNSASYRRRKHGRPAAASPLLDRMLALRAAGCSYSSIAAVMRLDHDLRMTADQVRYYVQSRREPRLPARRAA